jgi:RNA recognition motif-containing protein
MRLLVDNLPEGITEEELRPLFEPFGQVNHVLFVQIEGRTRGEVDMPSDDHAARAAEKLDGRDVRGRKIKVITTAMTESFL